MTTRILMFAIASLLLAACGRQGAILRPEPGVTVMKETDKAASQPIEDKPFVLDSLL